jgi:hypothetical protein
MKGLTLDTQATTLEAAPAAPGTISIGGKLFMTDAKGAHVPIDAVKPQRRLEDEVVRKILRYAKPLGEEIQRFRKHTFDDVDSFVALMEQQYSARGGAKGNVTLTSYDGCFRVQLAVADQIAFGAELKIAKTLVDECIQGWSADANANLRLVVNGAFDVDHEGHINRGRLLQLLSYEVTDERWLRAMDAIRDSIRIVGSKRYVRMYERDTPQAGWRPVALDVAAS